MTYEALPRLSSETAQWVADVFGDQICPNPTAIFTWMDREFAGLRATNPYLAELVQCYMEDFVCILDRCPVSPTERLLLQASGYAGVFVVLRALDLELRRRLEP